MRIYKLLKKVVLKITSHEWVKGNLTFYEEIKKSLKRLAQIKGNLTKPTKEV
jgi:ribosomal protein S2